ncbi:MAG: CopD family protein [Ideonella sp.]|jgi:uncharacterized membrane protein|nr:CopD family protein [Ideonella sp.]
MLYAVLNALHVLAIVLWVGGMAFAILCLRPAAQVLEPPQRLPLMRDALGRFFAVVTGAIVVTLVTGLWMIGRVAKATVQAGGSFTLPVDWLVMTVLGLLMMVIFGVLRLGPFRRMQRAVQASEWPAAADALARVRQLVHVNAALGTIVILVAVIGGAS